MSVDGDEFVAYGAAILSCVASEKTRVLLFDVASRYRDGWWYYDCCCQTAYLSTLNPVCLSKSTEESFLALRTTTCLVDERR